MNDDLALEMSRSLTGEADAQDYENLALAHLEKAKCLLSGEASFEVQEVMRKHAAWTSAKDIARECAQDLKPLDGIVLAEQRIERSKTLVKSAQAAGVDKDFLIKIKMATNKEALTLDTLRQILDDFKSNASSQRSVESVVREYNSAHQIHVKAAQELLEILEVHK
jgi:hypothetical protein